MAWSEEVTHFEVTGYRRWVEGTAMGFPDVDSFPKFSALSRANLLISFDLEQYMPLCLFTPNPVGRYSLCSSCGNAGHDGDCVGRRRRFRRWLTWPVARRGRVQGFPCRHYGRCVLDEHIAKRPMPEGAHSSQKAKRIEAERNGREQKSPAGRGVRAMY